MDELDALTARSHVLITGGSSGIGLASARELAKLGGHVHIAARRRAQLDEAVATIRSHAVGSDRTVAGYECDVTSAESVAGLFRLLRDRGAEPGIVVNSAGMTLAATFTDATVADIDHIMRVNYMGTVLVAAQAIPGMIARRDGYLLNVGSVASLIGVFGMSAYCASKFAVRGFTESIRSELKPEGIAVSLLCPPDTDTPMLEAERALRPPETEALSASAGVMSAREVARAAVRGMRRRAGIGGGGFRLHHQEGSTRLAVATGLISRMRIGSSRGERSGPRQPPTGSRWTTRRA